MENRYSLSAAALKYLAALCMLLDHMGVVFPQLFSGLGLPAALDLLPRCAGRLAFPIFAYFVAEGCRRTRFFHRYLLRLGVFALVSQVPYTLATGIWVGNVILTFFLAAAAVYSFERLVKAEYSLAVAALPLLGSCVLALLLNTDYGFPAVLLVFGLYLCGEDRRRLLLCLGAGLAVIYLVCGPLMGFLALPVLLPQLVGAYLAAAIPSALACCLCAELSLLPLACYRGQLGLQSKWFFYGFYPAHLLGLWALGLALN